MLTVVIRQLGRWSLRQLWRLLGGDRRHRRANSYRTVVNGVLIDTVKALVKPILQSDSNKS